MGSLEGRVAVVTGSGRGIGRAVALAMALEGAKLVVNDTGVAPSGSGPDPTVAQAVVDEIREAGGVAVVNADSVATINGGKQIVATATQSFGRLDILVNCAGISRPGLLPDITEEDWDMTIATHLKGHFACVQPAATAMMQQGYGRIVSISSPAALGMQGHLSYACAKGGVLAFTRVLARELAPHGITVNTVMPYARTRLMDVAKEAGLAGREVPPEYDQSPEDVAPIVVFLATKEAGRFNGHTIRATRKGVIELMSDPRALRSLYAEGGWSVSRLAAEMPGLLD